MSKSRSSFGQLSERDKIIRTSGPLPKLKRSGSCKLTVDDVVQDKAFNREVYYGDKALRYAPSEKNLSKGMLNWNYQKKKTTFLDLVMANSRKTVGPNQY
jgi:hypothetical protein